MALDTEPAGDVTVTIGGTTGTDLSLDPASLTFTEQNWDQPQTVTDGGARRRRGERTEPPVRWRMTMTVCRLG